MDYKITGYEPAQLFHFFEDVSAIPRGSGNEKGISDFLVAFAKERGLDVYQDEVYNVIIRKPASAGAENAPTVMLQVTSTWCATSWFRRARLYDRRYRPGRQGRRPHR